MLTIEGENKANEICLAYSKHPRDSGCCLLPSSVHCFMLDSGASLALGTDPESACSNLCPSWFCCIICMPVAWLKSKSAPQSSFSHKGTRPPWRNGRSQFRAGSRSDQPSPWREARLEEHSCGSVLKLVLHATPEQHSAKMSRLSKWLGLRFSGRWLLSPVLRGWEWGGS